MRTRVASVVAAVACAISLAVLGPGSAVAQSGGEEAWPQRTVRFIVPFGPGSASDITARLIAERMQNAWGKPVIVENRPGGDGLVSIGAFVSAKDDHTLFLTPSTTFLVHPYTHENLPYDFARDFKPIVWLTSTPIVIAVTSTLPVKTLPEFVEHAKRQAGKVNYGISGGFLEFVWDGWRRKRDVPMAKVPFRDIVQAPLDLAEGRIDILMTSITTHGPMLRAGKTKMLAICDPQRSPLASDIPTVFEAGFPELRLDSLNVLFGPSHMTAQVRQRVASDAAKALTEKDVIDRLRGASMTVSGAGPAEVEKVIAEQQQQVADIAKVLGVTRKR
jgi:tripartite-type tricarboxylate transporter receptor subunit TctC